MSFLRIVGFVSPPLLLCALSECYNEHVLIYNYKSIKAIFTLKKKKIKPAQKPIPTWGPWQSVQDFGEDQIQEKGGPRPSEEMARIALCNLQRHLLALLCLCRLAKGPQFINFPDNLPKQPFTPLSL